MAALTASVRSFNRDSSPSISNGHQFVMVSGDEPYPHAMNGGRERDHARRTPSTPNPYSVAPPTTAITRQNSASSPTATIPPISDTPEDLLRMTLTHGADTHSRPHSRSSSRRRPSLASQTALTPGSERRSFLYGDEGSDTEVADEGPEDVFGMRHGFEDEYNSEAYLAVLEQVFYMYYTDKRHESGGCPKEEIERYPLTDWRMRDRLKTVSAALVVCLNIGVDPPDVVKTNPCAKLECWIDTTLHPPAKALEMIGKNLQQQYEMLSIRTRYKQYLDPFVEDTKKFCCSLRRNAKDERILFHYNGHGVPKPTASGEIWVFNKNFTQYIPISLYDLQSWLGAPSLFVYDCSDAGNIVENFNRFIEKHEQEALEARVRDPSGSLSIPSYSDCIQLAACGKKETLPMNPELPADLFTCCLTTPIEVAVRFFILQNPLPQNVTVEQAMKIPGRLQERRTPLGELNWIFTAITDTIAWNSLDRQLFKKLFRQDLMVAALFRNFLLSQRIMRVHHCHPVSSPELPPTHNHPLWQSWDYAVEMVLAQLPALQRSSEGGPAYEYQHSQFFAEQLTAFEVYLQQGVADQKPPDQLPIVLQVLLSQVHRLRALILLSKFLDLGPWAVNLALSIGIFPYVLKLLQSAAQELKPVMIFIWARILAVDASCQTDLLKDNGYSYFIHILSSRTAIPVANASEHRAMCAFILSIFCRGFKQGQVVCAAANPKVMMACMAHLSDENPLLRQWACLCMSQLWNDYAEAKWQGVAESAHLRLTELTTDNVPEVRTAMLYALTTFLGIEPMSKEVMELEQGVASAVLSMTADGSSIVRRELVVFFSHFMKRNEEKFLVAAYQALESELDQRQTSKEQQEKRSATINGHTRQHSSNGSVITAKEQSSKPRLSDNTIFSTIYQALLMLSADPFAEVAQTASVVVDYILSALLDSSAGPWALKLMEELSSSKPRGFSEAIPSEALHLNASDTTIPHPQRTHTLTSSLRRTASMAAMSLKVLALGHAPADHEDESRGRLDYSSATLPRPSMQRAKSFKHDAAPQERSLPPDAGDYPITSGGTYRSAPLPTSRGFKARSLDDPVDIPVPSKFMEWSIEYFREPQMKPNEADEPGSVDYNQRLWRRTRNDKIIIETQTHKEAAANSSWSHHLRSFNNTVQPTRLLFHQFESHLVAVDDTDNVSIWDWEEGRRINRFSNGNPTGTKITEVKFFNEDDVALLMTGSSDGVVRIWRGYEQPGMELVAAWRALCDLLPSTVASGLVADWQQGRGTMLVGGDVKIIRVWDAPREICLTDIPARSGSCITSLTSEQVAGNIFVAGFGDGAVRVYDRRLPPRDSMVKVWKEHRSWIVKVHMQRGGMRELVSGSKEGEVRLWDIRASGSVKGFQASGRGLRSLGVHEHAPVVATGNTYNDIKIWNISQPQSSITAPSCFVNMKPFAPGGGGFLAAAANRVGGPAFTTALTFHPHRMILASAAGGATTVGLWSCEGV